MYRRARVEAHYLPLDYRRFVVDDGVAEFVVASEPFEEFTTNAGLAFTDLGPVDGRPDPARFGPEAAHAAIALRSTRRRPTPDASDGDLACVLDALERYFSEHFVDVPAGPSFDDVRPANLRNATSFALANLGRPELAMQLVAKYAPGACLEMLDETSHSDEFARAAIARRDAAIAARVDAQATEKKTNDEAARLNEKSNRERGVLVFCARTSFDGAPPGATECFEHGGARYWQYSLDLVVQSPIRAFDLPNGLRLLGDDDVVRVPVGKLVHRARGDVFPVIDVVLRARAVFVDARPIDPSEYVDDTTLDGQHRIRLAEKFARPWYAFDERQDVAVSALVRGLLLHPIVAAELLTRWRAEHQGPFDHVAPMPDEDVRRERARKMIEQAPIYHSPGELYVVPTEHELDVLALESGCDPWRALVQSATRGKKTITSEDLERELREQKQIEGSVTPQKHARIKRILESFGFVKKKANIEGQRRQAFVAEQPKEVEPKKKDVDVLHGVRIEWSDDQGPM